MNSSKWQFKSNFRFNSFLVAWAGSIFLLSACSSEHQSTELKSSSKPSVFQVQSGSPIYATRPVKSMGANMDIQFITDGSISLSGATNVYWENLLNGKTFCRQQSTQNVLETVINCGSTGELRITLVVLLKSGQTKTYSATVTLLSEPEAPDEPTDIPADANGEVLFNQSCAGCHRASDKARKTSAQIRAAINSNTGNMGFLSGLNTSEIEAIAKYLAP